MLEKLKSLGNLPLVIILIIVIIIAIVLSILKTQKTEEINSNANMSNITKNEEAELEEEQEQQEYPEDEIIDAVDPEENEEEQEEQEENIEAKYFIRVNYGQNVVTIYTKDNNGEYTVPYKVMVCSTGTATPRSGTYTMPSSGSKSPRGVWGMMIGNVWAQYYTRIKGSILFHSVPYTEKNKWSLEYWEYDKLGTAASAGCIRLTVEDAKWIYNNCLAGTKVEFYTDSNPGPLGKPTAQKISEHEEVRGWDPTDPDSANPWKTYTPEQETEEPEEDNKPTTPTKPTKPATPSTSIIPEEKPNQNPEQGTTNEGGDSGDNQEGNEGVGEENKNPSEGEATNPDEELSGGEDNSGDNTGNNSEENDGNSGVDAGGEQEGGTSGEGNTSVTPENDSDSDNTNV